MVIYLTDKTIFHFEKKFEEAWDKFCEFYDKNGAHRYKKEFRWGPFFRVESDIVFRLAKSCEEIFGPGYVHLNSPIGKDYFDNFKKEEGKTKWIDIDISRPEAFMSKKNRHDIFIEVKWIREDVRERARTRMRICNDLKKLNDQLARHRCQYAFMCIIEDNPHYSKISDEKMRWQKEYPRIRFFHLPCKQVFKTQKPCGNGKFP